jgi:Gamma-glutamyl cyclotransferase, AIG2-like
MDVAAMARRCPRSKALGLARLERHRVAVMREGWLTAIRNPSSAVHGVLWDLALSDIPALDRHESLSQGLYVKLTQAVIADAARNGQSSISARIRGPAFSVQLTLLRSWPRQDHGLFRRRASMGRRE